MRLRILLICFTVSAAIAPSALAAPPANDDFAYASEIPALPATFEIDTTEAQDDFSDPDPSCSGAGASVWFRFTAPHDLTLGLSTDGSGFNTVLAVWRGSSLGSLEEVKCNDSRYGWDEAWLDVGVHGGETVMIQAGGSSFYDVPGFVSTGLLKLRAYEIEGTVHFRPPPNDDVADATAVSIPFSDGQETDSATLEEAEPGCSDGLPLSRSSTASVWYSFAPSEPTPITISAGGRDQEIFLGIYESASGSLIPVRCAYVYGLYRTAFLDLLFLAQPDTTYMIQVGTYNSHADGFADGTSIGIQRAQDADLLVRDLSVVPVEYQTDAGGVVDPAAFDVRFTLDRTSGPYLDGAWRVEACPGPAAVIVGDCALIDGGDLRYRSTPKQVRVRWRAVAAGHVTIVATISSDRFFDPEPSNDAASASVVVGPIGDIGVVP